MNEFELIALLTSEAPRSAEDLALGVGDDCAVIAGPAGRQWLITADALTEGVHFERGWSDLESLGRKSLSVNLSDIAAMGGRPRFWLCTIFVPSAVGAEGAVEIYRGMRSVAAGHGAILVGGDTSSSAGGLSISVTVVGEVDEGRAILRSGARAGDAIYVTGGLGGAALGLECARRSLREKWATPFIKRLVDPAPRVAAAEALARAGALSSMVDISDGLLADLDHVAAASGTGYGIEAGLVPQEPGLAEFAPRVGAEAVRLALAGGEDYELLFTVPAGRAADFERTAAPAAGVRVTRIGRMTESQSRRVVAPDGSELQIARRGFDHFGGMA